MKILHLSSETSWRGGEQQIAYLLEEQLRQGLTVLVICRPGSATASYCLQQHIPFITAGIKNSLDVGTAWKLKQICKKEKIDLVHVHSSRGHAIVHLAQLLGLRIPYILTRRVAFPIANKGLNILRYNSSQLKKIICISSAVMASTAPVVREQHKLRVIYDGIDLNRFSATAPPEQLLRQELGLADNTLLVGTVAALTAEKDLTTFIRAAGELADVLREAHFVIAGDGPERSALQTLTQLLHLEERLHFLGRRSDIPQLLPQLSLFLFTSRMEGLGTSVLDAFACRIPVVATAAGGIPEIVRHEVTGLLAPVGDAQGLAREAQRLLNNPALQSALVEHAHRLLLRSFTKEKMAADTLGVYQQVLAGQDQ